jgi:transcriptional regulator with XRE-family HTH domain
MQNQTGHVSLNLEFRQRLQEELVRRCRVNPKYSLRAFARLLDVSPTYLSLILNGKRPIPVKLRAVIAERLGLKLFDTETGENPSTVFNQLAADRFALISDWYHYAILELIQVTGFRPTVPRIAAALGITQSEAKDAVDRLIRLEMIEVQRNGTWRNISGQNTNFVDRNVDSAARKKLQMQVLEKAMAALREIPLSQRDQTSMTMAIDVSRLPEAIFKIKKFRRELSHFLESGGRKDQVYNLAVSLYPISNLKSNQKGKI